MPDRAEILASVCDLIARGETEQAKGKLVAQYPCGPASTPRSKWPLNRLVAVFARDGYTDRYSGSRLVFPGTLRALSILMEEAFPYHPNWKQAATHPAFWELYPTIDHVVPVARGGADDESNVVTTSMLRNSAKSNWLLAEVGWSSQLAPIVHGWDGLVGWFCSVAATFERLREDAVINRWRNALRDGYAA
jgi:5-methylcytosine-specific restriction endonuclease McrA